VINYGNRKYGGRVLSLQEERECVPFAEFPELLGVILAILQKILWLRRELLGAKYLPKEFRELWGKRSGLRGIWVIPKVKVTRLTSFFQSLLAISRATAS
jgi:hypothetical protein